MMRGVLNDLQLCSSGLPGFGLHKSNGISRSPGNIHHKKEAKIPTLCETFLKCSILRVLGLAPETTATRLELKSLSAMYTSLSSAMLTWSTEIPYQLMLVNIWSSTCDDCQLAICKYYQMFELKTHHFCRQGQGHLWSWESRGSSPLACQPRRIW